MYLREDNSVGKNTVMLEKWDFKSFTCWDAFVKLENLNFFKIFFIVIR